MKQPDSKIIREIVQEARSTRITLTLIYLVWAAYSLVIITAYIDNDIKSIQAALVGCILQLLPYILVRRKNLLLGSLLVVLFSLGTITLLATVGQGIRDLAIISIPIIFIFAGLTLDRFFFRIIVVVAVLALNWLSIGEARGWFVTRPFNGEYSNWIYLINVAVLCLIAAIAVDLLATNMRKNLGFAQQEILQRKQVEDALRASETQYRFLVNNTSDDILRLDRDCKIVFTTETAHHFHGHDPFKILNTSIWDFIHPEDHISLSEALNRIIETGLPGREEYRFKRKDGTHIWVEATGNRVYRMAEKPEVILIQRDITDRKHAEEESELTKKRFHVLIEHGRDNISLLAADGTLLWENSTTENMLGYAQNQFLGHNIFEIIHPDDQGWTSDMYAQVLQKSGNIQAGEFRLRHADGSWRWIECSAVNLLDKPGVQAVVLNYRDISKRKLAEKALQESEERFALSMDATSDGLWDWDILTSQVYYSPNYYHMLGYEADEFPMDTSTWENLLHPEDKARILQTNLDCINGLIEQFEVEFRMKAKNGEWCWIFTRGKCITRDEQGLAKRLLGTHMNITERKREQDELFKQMSLLDTVIESSTDSIFVKDQDGKYIIMNKTGAHFIGYSVKEVLGHTDRELFPPKTAYQFQKADAETVESNSMTEHEEIIEVSGKKRVFLARKTPWRDHNGKIIGVIGTANDITERKSAEDQLRYQGTHDALTGIYNRTFFEAELERLEHSRVFPISIILADVDKLKVVNDTYGHAAGDTLLKLTANMFSSIFREGDILARIGGDEFAILLPDTNSATAEDMVTRTQESMRKQNSEHLDLPIQVSLGTATTEIANLKDTFSLADQRMYADKATRSSRLPSNSLSTGMSQSPLSNWVNPTSHD
ncbi:MAG: PAS domain S-box protein [Chloroflexota bacterium]